MIAARFHHELSAPLLELQSRLADNICIHSEINDVTAQAARLAIAAYHFPETVHVKKMSMQEAENLRQRLGDVANTAKHGTLDSPSRQVTLFAGLAYEADENLGFRFLRTELWARNVRFGELDLVASLVVFCEALASELGISFDTSFEYPMHPFHREAVAYLAKETFYAKNVRLFCYSKDSAGNLVRARPKEIEFVILER